MAEIQNENQQANQAQEAKPQIPLDGEVTDDIGDIRSDHPDPHGNSQAQNENRQANHQAQEAEPQIPLDREVTGDIADIRSDHPDLHGDTLAQTESQILVSASGDNSQAINATDGSNVIVNSPANPQDGSKEPTPEEPQEAGGGEKDGTETGSGSTVASGAGSTAVNAKNSKVSIKDIRISAQTVIMNDLEPQKSDEASSLRFSEVEEKELLKVADVFAEPDDYRNSLEDIFSNDVEDRFYIVQGPENSGKYTTALKLWLDICDNKKIKEKKAFSHVGRNTNIRSLIDFLVELKKAKPSVYVLSDAFESGLGLSVSDFSNTIISIINKYLSEHDAYLILTTSKTRDDIQTIQARIISAAVKDASLRYCFTQHYAWYQGKDSPNPLSENLVALINQNIDDLNKDFKNPAQINHFFYQISRNELQVIVRRSLNDTDKDFSDLGDMQNSPVFKDALLRLAQRARRYGLPDQGSTEVWFGNLPENIKLFALLAIILQGFSFNLIEEIYIQAVQKLRDDKLQTIEHHATFGRDVIFTSIHARLDEKGFIVFDNQVYVIEVKKQIDSRHLLLWPLIDIFVDYIDRFKEREYWEHRRELGAALGRIGIYAHGKLDAVLDSLANSDESGVVAASGYALAEICNLDVKYHAYVVQTIARWVKSGDPDLMWAAGASIWRVYDSLERFLKNQQPNSSTYQTTEETIRSIYKSLSELAGNVDSFNDQINQTVALKVLQIASEVITKDPDLMLSLQQAQAMEAQLKIWVENNMGSVLHAVWQMLWLKPNEVVSLVCDWMNAKPSKDIDVTNLRVMGLLSATELFKRTTGMQKQELLDNIPLTQLIQPLLARGDRSSIQQMMQSLGNWMSNPEMAQRFEEVMLPIVNRLSENELNNLRDGIIEVWLKKPAKSHTLGKFLLSRSYTIQGAPIGLHEHTGLKLIWDTTLPSRKKGIDSLARNLFIRVGARQNISLYPMGHAKSISFVDSYPSLEELQLVSDLPRLVYPVISSMKLSETDSVIVLMNDEILDFEDLESDLVKDHMLILYLQGSPEKPKYDIPLESWVAKDDYRKIEHFLTGMIGSNLLRISPEILWAEIQSLVSLDKNIELISSSLNEWITLLDSPSSIQFGIGKSKTDLARLLSYTLVWLTHQDLDACLLVLDGWIENASTGDDPLGLLRYKIGLAGGKLVVNVLGCDDSIPLEKFTRLSGLLRSLITQENWEVHRVILTALRLWLENEMIYKAFCLSTLSDDGAEKDKSLFSLLIEHTPKENYKEFIEVLDTWLQDKNVSPVVRRAAQAIGNKIRIRQDVSAVDYSDFEKQVYASIQTGAALPELPENQKYCLVIFNSSQSNQEYASIAAETFHVLARDAGYYPIICRVGQRMPVALGRQEISPDLLFNPEMYELPQVIGPLFENLHAGQFALLIFFGSDEFHDKEDWHEQWRKIFSFQYPVKVKDLPGWPPRNDENSIPEQNKRIALQIVKFSSDRVSKG